MDTSINIILSQRFQPPSIGKESGLQEMQQQTRKNPKLIT